MSNVLYNLDLDNNQVNFIRIQLSFINEWIQPGINCMSEIIVEVDRYPIRLGQFLKLANAVQDGFEAKAQIVHGEVSVNGVIELRRGRQLNRDDRVGYQGFSYVCR